uniref:Retrotransposon gag domain-containing protein n=1 Tax=Setaria italica TaxID=4555 RepID=K3ZLR6_SETIT
MYSGTGNVMLMVEIEDHLHDLKQGGRSVIDYVAELKSLWADADYLKPIELPHSDYVGLNPEFEARCSTMFHQPNLPSLEDAIAAITREESRLNANRGRGRGSGRGAPRGRDRGGRGGYRANVVGTEEELIRAEASSSSGGKDQDDYVGDFANFAYIDEGKANREESWDCDQA